MTSLAPELQKRILSGIVMVAVALTALWAGGHAFWALISLLAILMMFEWAAMMKAALWKTLLALLFVAAVQVCALLFVDGTYLAIDLACVGAIFIAVVAFSARLGAGLLYVTVPALALIFLRQQDDGLVLALWTLVIVWATDIGAYFAGRAIGGPKLAPKISPNKTWAGLIGGMVAALLIGATIAFYAKLPYLFMVMGAPLAVAAQLGDLFESWLKRRSGVKDSGKLFPGHGGALDRLDGVVPVAVLVAAAVASGAFHAAA